MLLIKLALVALIGWVIYEKVRAKLPEWEECIYEWVDTFEEWVMAILERLGTKSPSKVYMDACHAGIRRPRNRLRFLRELEDFCRYEGLDLKVWEDLEFDALGIRLHDKNTNRVVQARVKREDYESTPIASANRIKRAWEGGTREKPGVEIEIPNDKRDVVLQAVKDYAEKEGIKVTYSGSKPRREYPPGFFEKLCIHKDWRKK